MLGRCIDLGNPVSDHPLNRGLVSWWLPLPNNKGGRKLFDLKGKNHGTLSNGAAWRATATPFEGVYYDGEFNGGNYNRVTASPVGLAADYTLFAAFSPVAVSGKKLTLLRVDNDVGSGSGGWNWKVTNSQELQVDLNGAVVSPGSQFVAGGIYRVCSTRVGSAVTHYVNGRVIHSGTNNNSRTGSTDSLYVGSWSDEDMYGWLTDVRIYDSRCLSASDVFALYDQSLRGHPDTLRYFTPTVWSFAASAAPAGMVHPRRSRRVSNLLRM